MRPVLRLSLALVVALAALRLPAALPVAAHGGGTPRLTNASLGALSVSVWTTPEPLRVGTVHVTVALGDQDGAPVLDRDVRVVAMMSDGGLVQARATHDSAENKLFYETDLTLDRAGAWTFTIAVAGEDGELSFVSEVADARDGVSLPVIGVALLAVGVIAVVLWRRGRRA